MYKNLDGKYKSKLIVALTHEWYIGYKSMRKFKEWKYWSRKTVWYLYKELNNALNILKWDQLDFLKRIIK
jgi:hypothetical protein